MKQRSKLRALLPGAEIAARVDLGPRGAGLRQRLDLGAVAEFGRLLPVRDDLEIGDLFEAGEHGVLVGVVDLLPAGVVVPPLHVADFQRPREVLLEKRDVLEEQLFLKVLGAGGNDDPLARKQRRNQVRERLARCPFRPRRSGGVCPPAPIRRPRPSRPVPAGTRNSDATGRAFRLGRRIVWRLPDGPGWASRSLNFNRARGTLRWSPSPRPINRTSVNSAPGS